VALLAAGVPAQPAAAASAEVVVRDNRFEPREVRIDPGDTVTWTNQGSRVHDLKADNGEFRSRDMRRGDRFSHTFRTEGYFFYHCTYHGSKGRVGMWGVVIVGDPPPPPEPLRTRKSRRPRLLVPDDFTTIQAAVNHARSGTTVVVKPGTYREQVVVTTPRLVIRGVDRFRTILHGNDRMNNGIIVDGANNVTVKNLTVRNFTSNGIYFNNSDGYKMARIDAINDRVYGLYAFDSYEGTIRDSFTWGSGDAGVYIGECLGCAAVVRNLHAEWNLLGYSGTNATGVAIVDSTFVNNAVGIFPNSLAFEELGPNRGTTIVDNVIARNNNTDIRAASIWETFGVPTGTGVWLYGTENNTVMSNTIKGHDSYGVLVTVGMDRESLPMNNTIVDNLIRSAAGNDLAWDGTGADNCFSNNDITGATGPPEIQTVYACANRPFLGVPYAPVGADVGAAIATGQLRGGDTAPEPKRPRCQRGAPGCSR